VFIALSFMGTPEYGIETPAATRIIQDLAPEEGEGPLREIPYPELFNRQAVYIVGQDYGTDLCPGLSYQPDPEGDVNNVVVGCPHLTAVFNEFSERLEEAEANGSLPELNAKLTVEQFQPGLVKITPHVEWIDAETGRDQKYEHTYFLHEDRGGE
jgi:hypothetical protein